MENRQFPKQIILRNKLQERKKIELKKVVGGLVTKHGVATHA